MDLKRRDFLKVVGLGAAGSMLPGCGGETAKLIPYVLPDEEIVPGVANWYASVCRECEAGCGIIVRVMEGRARKIEGNPDHPLNRGKLCALGQASLQGLYNPDRIRGPLQRDGERGEGRFKPIPWEEAMSRWVSALQKHPGGAVLISRPVPGTLAGLFSTFMKEISGTVFFYEPSAERPLRAANRKSFGIDFLPDYDLANTTYLLSFGAPFLSHWLSPVHFGAAYGRMRQGRPEVRGRFVQVEPRLSLTAASADRWVPIRPGTEGLLAVAIGRLILEEGRTNLPRGDRSRFEKFYASFSIDRIANETGVAEEEIVRLAREFYTAASPLAIGGGIASEQTNGTDTLVAINALNLLVGNINRPGGIRFFRPSDFPASSAEVVGEQALLDLKGPSKKASRSVLMLYQANPLYTLPPSTQFRQVFEEADLVVSFSPFLDESTAMADLILPDHFFLESWGDHVTEGIAPAAGLAQPVVIPRYDTRPVGDLFLGAANRFGGGVKERLSWTDYRTMVREQWRDFFDRRQPGQPFEAAWVEALQKGGWWKPEGKPVSISQRGAPSAAEPARFEGSEKEFPFYFYPFPSMGLHYGQGANRPWLQELPDPMTTVVWGSWVEINPKTAQEYGLAERDLVRVISPYGEIEAPVVYFPGNPPDLISVPIGQGHRAYGRYAEGRGVNPLALLAPLIDAPSGALATGATRVRIERTGRKGRPVLVDQTGQGTRRHTEGGEGEA
ncbi:molybdopterin-containing oxidoreductase family protein [Candidatus Manganitrophus noduliformans]|uniref:Molybdopterin-dependent oxidoreductase n=1 Tax=Candidatus Manganitrophus noduliformans TaxID=2606439 RepID=A0A7X6DP02_9BACT|nr:molybdopterin-dependent oxidoreductase [Candidatus Manganitrophus noduliformans]NKE70756.1 molybdopterin-dependent oxidoreductase [Candidatus Manganitrophus noduliformans]